MIMKKIYYLLFIPLFLLTSCIEDNGNYTYSTLKEVTIDGLSSTYRFVLQQAFSLNPTVTTDIDPSNLSYCWRIGNDTIAKTQKLDYTFKQTLSSTDPLTFEVYDKTTNVRYVKRMTITVVSPFNTGWLILSDAGGKPVLSFKSYEQDSAYYADVYNSVNNESLSGKAKMVKQLRYSDYNTGAVYDRVTVVCSNGKSAELDGVSLLRKKYYEDEYKGEGSLNIGTINSENYYTDASMFIVNNGKIYEKAPGGIGTPDDGVYQYPLYGDAKDYSVANTYAKAYYNYYLMVDELNKRYVWFTQCSLSAKITSLAYDTKNSVGKVSPDTLEGTSVWLGVDYNNRNLSILKTPAGKYVMHVLTCTWDATFACVARYEIPDGVINDESCFAAQKSNPYLMIGTGKDLYALNLDALSSGATAVNKIHTYDGQITAMQYAYDANKNVNDFAISTYNGTTSSLLVVNPSLISGGQILKRVDNVAGKIVSFARKL
jgi:hypothetical protein